MFYLLKMPRDYIMEGFSTIQIILFLLIDFIILASVVAGAFFLFLFVQTKRQKQPKVTNLNDLEMFKNRNLENETNVVIENNRPVAPSSISKERSRDFAPPFRTNGEDSQKLFSCQMKENQMQMNTTASQSNTNFFNM